MAGCLAQRWGEKIREEIPGVDAVLGMADRLIGASFTRGKNARERTYRGRLRERAKSYAKDYLALFRTPIFACEADMRPSEWGSARQKLRWD